MLTLLTHCFIPSVYYVWPDDDYLCRVFVALFCLPYIQFLFNLYMSIMDRYVAVTRSIWHRTAFTLNQCIVWLSILNGLLAILVKWSFLSLYVSLECAIHPVHGLTILLAILVLFILCTGFFIAVFVVTWRHLKRDAAAAAAAATPVATAPSSMLTMQQTSTNHPAAADIEYVALKDLLPSTSTAPSSVLGPRNDDDDGGGGNESINAAATTTNHERPIMMSPPSTTTTRNSSSASSSSSSSSTSTGSSLRRMELQVTKHFLVTLLPLFVIVCPLFVFGVLTAAYSYLAPDSATFATLMSYIPHFGLLPTIHVVIYPVANLIFNKEINGGGSCSSSLSSFCGSCFIFSSSSSSSCCCCFCSCRVDDDDDEDEQQQQQLQRRMMSQRGADNKDGESQHQQHRLNNIDLYG